MLTNTIWDVQSMPPLVCTPGVQQYLDSMYMHLYKWRYGADGALVHTTDKDGLVKRVAAFTFKLCQYLRANDIDIRQVQIFIPTMLSEVILTLYLTEVGYSVKLYMLGYYKMIDCVPKYNIRPMGNIPDPYNVCQLVSAIRASIGHKQCMSCHYSDDTNNYCGLGLDMYTVNCSKRRLISVLYTIQGS